MGRSGGRVFAGLVGLMGGPFAGVWWPVRLDRGLARRVSTQSVAGFPKPHANLQCVADPF